MARPLHAGPARWTRLGSSLPESTESLLRAMQRNLELSEEDARNELRWIRQAVRDRETRAATAVLSVKGRGESVAELVERRVKGEPLQYILGDTDFGPLTIRCRPPTLIPRPETAHIMTRLAEAILATVSSGFSVVDLCTGSGCVPLLLRQLLRSRINRVVGVDISPQAIELAEENATSLQLNADFAQLDLFDPSAAKRVIELAEGKVGLLISNPPYIPLDEYKALPQSVRAYEDPRALLGDPDGGDGDGLAFYRRIAELLPAILDQNLPALKGLPRLAVEIGEKQGQAVRDVFIRQNAGVIVRTEVWPDQYGRDRAVVGWTR